jgi:hypothetical protein
MRNIAISPGASFHTRQRWDKAALPIGLSWHSTLWRYIVPGLWIVGWVFWIGIVSVDAPQAGLIFYGLLFVGIPVMLALTAGWWVKQLLDRRHTGTLMVEADYLEWQFDSGSDVDLLTDCSRFECMGKRNPRIEWDIASGEGEAADGWPAWTRRWRVLQSLKSDRVLYGRDVGLDAEALGGLCAFLNQLRDEALAAR